MNLTTSPSTNRRLLRVDEVRHRLGLGRTKTYSLISNGRIRSTMIDGALRVFESDLEAFIDELFRRRLPENEKEAASHA